MASCVVGKAISVSFSSQERSKDDDRCHLFFHKLLTSPAGRRHQNAVYLVKNAITCSNICTDYHSAAYPDGRAFGGIGER